MEGGGEPTETGGEDNVGDAGVLSGGFTEGGGGIMEGGDGTLTGGGGGEDAETAGGGAIVATGEDRDPCGGGDVIEVEGGLAGSPCVGNAEGGEKGNGGGDGGGEEGRGVNNGGGD